MRSTESTLGGGRLSASDARHPLMPLTDLHVRKEKPGELVERQHGVRVRYAGQRVDTG